MVAAMTSYLYFPLIKSAALRKTAARSENGRLSQSSFAANAASMAVLTSAVDAFDHFATTLRCEAGLICDSESGALI